MRGDLERGAEQRLRSGGAKTDDHLRLDQRDLGIQPRSARADLAGARLLVNAPLAARLPLEMLHDVGDINDRAIDARIGERAIEEFAGRTDERVAAHVLGVPWLLADEHQ